MEIRKGKFNIKAFSKIMTRRYFVVLFVAASVCFGCSSESEAGKGSTASQKANSVSVPIGSTAAPADPGNAVAITDNLMPQANKRPIVDHPNEKRPVLQFEPAAEDSQIASTMTSTGKPYEVRVWKKHPLLLKVEATWIDPQNKALLIVLRNKQVFNITTDRIVNLKMATADQLLDIAGVKPGEAEASGKTGAKKAP